MGKTHAIALALLLAAGLPFAQATYLDVCGIDQFNSSSSDALSLIGLAFALVSLAIALAYMYSHVRQDARLSTWARDEAANLLLSALMFAGILLFFTGSCKVAESYSGQSPFDASESYLRTLIQTNGLNVLRGLTYGSIGNQLDATVYLYMGMTPVYGSGLAGRANFRAHSAAKEFLIDLYLPILASLNAQLYILQGIKWVAASVLLPFAFVMRIFPPTRQFGNLLIAIFFGLYIVVPTMYAMSGKAFGEITAAPDTVYPALHNFYSYGIGPESYQQSVLYRIGSTIPQAVFLPNLVIIVTTTCVMALSKAMRQFEV